MRRSRSRRMHLPFVITRHVNRVRDPDGYDRMARAKQTVFTGMLVNQMI